MHCHYLYHVFLRSAHQTDCMRCKSDSHIGETKTRLMVAASSNTISISTGNTSQVGKNKNKHLGRFLVLHHISKEAPPAARLCGSQPTECINLSGCFTTRGEGRGRGDIATKREQCHAFFIQYIPGLTLHVFSKL